MSIETGPGNQWAEHRHHQSSPRRKTMVYHRKGQTPADDDRLATALSGSSAGTMRELVVNRV